jgi:hypothetical protein
MKTGILFSFSKNENLEIIELENQLGKYKFTKSGDKWFMTEPGNFRLNQRKMAILEKFIFELPVNRILEMELEEYGFDTPTIKVKFETTNNRHFSFNVGNFTPSQSQIYLKDLSDETVYVCDSAVISQLNGSLDAYRDTNIFDVDIENLTTVSFFEEGQKSVSLEKAGPFSWRLTFPYEANARALEINEFLINLKKFSAVKFVDINDHDYSSMGLAPSHYSIELADTKGNFQRLEFGGEKEGLVFIRMGSEEDIARIFDIDIDFTILKDENLIFETPLRATIDQVAKIDVIREGKRISMEIDHSSDPPKFYFGASELLNDLFISFFVRYSGLSADGFHQQNSLINPQIVMTTTYVDGKIDEVKLFYRNSESYFIESNGQSNYFVKKEKVEELLKRLEKATSEIIPLEIT